MFHMTYMRIASPALGFIHQTRRVPKIIDFWASVSIQSIMGENRNSLKYMVEHLSS